MDGRIEHTDKGLIRDERKKGGLSCFFKNLFKQEL